MNGSICSSMVDKIALVRLDCKTNFSHSVMNVAWHHKEMNATFRTPGRTSQVPEGS